MKVSDISSSWDEIDGIFYQKHKLFDLNTAEFSQPNVKLSPLHGGGPFLSYRKRTAFFVDTLTNTGEKTSKCITGKSDIHSAFWLTNGMIGAIHYDGSVEIYSATIEYVKTVPSPSLSPDFRVAATDPTDDGIVMISSTNEVFVFEHEEFASLGTMQIKGAPSAIAYNGSSAFIGTYDGKVYSDQMAVQISGQVNHILCYPGSSTVAVLSNNNLFICCDKGSVQIPYQVSQYQYAWINDGVLLVSHGDDAEVYGLRGLIKAIDIPRIQVMFQDYPTVRIITDTSFYMYEQVNDALLSMVGDRDLQTLIDCYQFFEASNVQCYKLLGMLSTKLNTILIKIVEALPYILSPIMQEEYLSICCFAKATISDFDHDIVASVIKRLRVLNQLRRGDVGFATSNTHLESPDVLVAALAGQRMLDMANVIAECYNVQKGVIAENWAIQMFETFNGQYLDGIIENLSNYDCVDYKRLAVRSKSLDFNPIVHKTLARRIRDPLERFYYLLENFPEEVESDVLSSQDGEVIYRYLLIKKDELSNERFKQLLESSPVFTNHYIAYKKYIDTKTLTIIDTVAPQKKFVIGLMWNELFGKGLVEQPVNKKSSEQSKAFVAAVNNQVQLNKIIDKNKELDSAGKPAVSPRETLRRAVILDKKDVIKHVCKIYGVSDAQLTWIKLKTYCQEGMWEKIIGMVARSLPIKHVHFVEMCNEYGKADIAKMFAEKIPNSEERAQVMKTYGFE